MKDSMMFAIKRANKCISIFIVLIMTLALLPTGIIVRAEIIASGICGNNLTYELDDEYNLIISGTGDMNDYSTINKAPWGRAIKSVVMNNGVTSIGANAFRDCVDLKTITMPDSVVSIGDSAFEDCTGLTSITIPDSVMIIGSGAFINTGYYNNESNWENGVLYIGNHLIRANESVSGDYSIKNSTIVIASAAFMRRTKLTSVTIPDSVTSICHMAFNNCSSLTSVTIPDGVTIIGSAFSGCTGLVSITMPDSVTITGGGAFINTGYYNNESNWENGVLYIGNWLIKAKKDIAGDYTTKNGTVGISVGAFSECDNMTSVTIPDSVTSIGDLAFIGCTNLKRVMVYKGSYAHSYVISKGLDFILIPPIRMEVYRLPNKLQYLEGKGSLDVAGGMVMLHYDNGTYEEIQMSNSMVSGFDNTRVGLQTLVVTYEGLTATFDVEVKAKTLIDMRITSQPTNKRYIEYKGDLDLRGGRYTLYYDNDATETFDITVDMVSGFDITSVGVQILTVSYGNYYDTFEIEVVPKSINGIAIATLPQKLTYISTKAEELDLTGGRITVYYDNDATDEIDLVTDMVSGFNNTSVGVQTLFVSYGGVVTSFNVEVLPKKVSEIVVSSLPDKTSYLEGKEGLDVTGGMVMLYYNDDTVREAHMIYINGCSSFMFTDDFSIVTFSTSGFDNTLVGKCMVTITYDGCIGTFDVFIIAKELLGISMISAPNKSVYETKEALDLSGGRIRLNYNNGTYEYANLISVAGMTRMMIDGESVSKEVIVTGFESKWGGVKTVIISYEGMEASFCVTVNGDIRGDFDGDGVITVSDALSALRIAAKLAPETAEAIAIGDIDGDGAITVADALSILRVAAKLADSL